MSKYKVGDELLIINSNEQDKQKMKENCFLDIVDDFSTFSWSIKIVNVEYKEPEVVLSYKTAQSDDIYKVFAICKDIENFDTQKVLEKALLKAHLQELIKLSTLRDHNLTKIK